MAMKKGTNRHNADGSEERRDHEPRNGGGL